VARHFRGYPSRPVIVGKSALVGNAYDFTVAESATAAETLTNLAVFANTLSESVSATDTSSSAAVFASSISETGSASDSITGGLLLTGTASESASASDTDSALAVFASAQAESGTAADTDSASVVFGPTLSESGSSSDTIAAAAVFGSTVSETGSASDSDSGAAVFADSLSETATAADSVSAGATTINETVAETATAIDSLSAEFISTAPVAGGGPAFPYPRSRRGPGRGRPLKDICDELERELAEPVIALAPGLDQFAGEYFGRQIDELEGAIAAFIAERRAEERDALNAYRETAVEAHANALLRRLRDEEEMCAILLLTHH